jgi:hypothetical protein
MAVAKSFQFRRFGLCLLLFLAASAPGQPLLGLSQYRIQRAVLPIFSEPDLVLLGVLRVDAIYTDYQRRGFFRIGALPILVAEGVTFEFCQPGKAVEGLANLHHSLGRGGGRTVMELRKVSFRFSDEPSPRLQVQRVLVQANGQWELRKAVLFSDTDHQLNIDKAILDTIGPSAGRLTSEATSASRTVSLLASQVAPATPTPRKE